MTRKRSSWDTLRIVFAWGIGALWAASVILDAIPSFPFAINQEVNVLMLMVVGALFGPTAARSIRNGKAPVNGDA